MRRLFVPRRSSAQLVAEQNPTARPRHVAAPVAARSCSLSFQGPMTEPAGPSDVGIVFGAMVRREHLLRELRESDSGSFHQRCLLEGQVSFTSKKGRYLFQEALDNGHMENYF